MQRLHFNDQGLRSGYSGVQATLFGGTSQLGALTGSHLTMKGSAVIYPHRAMGDVLSNNMKELKVTADLGNKAFARLPDMTSEKECAYAMKSSNTVISCVGNRVWARDLKEFEDSNIRVPMAIAKAAKMNKNTKRFVYISAAGADPNSQSKRLRTKWIGEQEVKEIFPDVTILRPTYIMGHHEPNHSIQGKWGQ